MAIVASHISPPPYLAVTSGPSSHSPPPICIPIITIAGPIMRVQCFHSIGNGSGRSATSQVGRQVCGSCAAAEEIESSDEARGGDTDITWVSSERTEPGE